METRWHSMRIPLNQGGQALSLKLEYDPLQVYAPAAYSSVLLVRNIAVKPDDAVLDICTGTGVYAVGAALLGAHSVVAVDASPIALNAARHNAELNGVADRVDFRQGSMFDPVADVKFSLILSNPPCLPDPGQVDLTIPGTIMLSGPDGTRNITHLLERAPDYLLPGGRIVFVHPSTANPRKVFRLLDECYKYEILAEIEIPFYLHFLELWDYLQSLKDRGLCEFFERAGVPYRTYWLIRAQPK